MNYFLFKLEFTTSLHVGESDAGDSLDTGRMNFCADTLFSALCHMALKAEGVQGIERWVNLAQNDELRFSDAFPYKGETLYVPKPYATASVRLEIPPELRKAMKKLSYLPIGLLPDFIASLQGKMVFDAAGVDTDFGVYGIVDKVSITAQEVPRPYSVGVFTFHDDAGLYFIVGCADKSLVPDLQKLIRLLGVEGIGGKVSSGYGKFRVKACIDLEATENEDELLLAGYLQKATVGEANRYITLTTSLPMDQEMHDAVENSTYGLVRRGGFVQSETYADTPLKKQTQYFFDSGSMFQYPYRGGIFDVSGNRGKHPVYRYGKPVFLGVCL